MASLSRFFIDPYTGEISGKNSAEKFIGLVLNLHKNLALSLFKNENLSKFASELVALSTIAFAFYLDKRGCDIFLEV